MPESYCKSNDLSNWEFCYAKNPSDAARLITEKYNYPSDEELIKLEKHVYNDTAQDTVHNWNKKIREIVK